ncbi:nuclear transport factor 2 family protein [Flavihumibacter sp. R14]|nr:nuclear transport factor 2 family protein [Flavihumibacter soli]
MKPLLFVIIICSLYSCNAGGSKTERENMGIAKKYMEAVETKNVAMMDSLLADDYMGYGPSIGDSTNKQEALKGWKDNAEHLYKSIEYTRHKELAVTVPDGEAKGDWVLNWAYLTIKYKDGRGPVNLWVNAVYRIEDGKIVHSRTFYNEADALRQLGYSIVPPKK